MKLLNSAIINEFTMLTYRRPLGKDDQYDSAIVTNQSQSIIWAMGPINNKVGTYMYRVSHMDCYKSKRVL